MLLCLPGIDYEMLCAYPVSDFSLPRKRLATGAAIEKRFDL